MLSSRSLARCLLLLSLNAVLLGGANARPHDIVAPAIITPAPLLPRQLFPKPSTSITGTSTTISTDTSTTTTETSTTISTATSTSTTETSTTTSTSTSTDPPTSTSTNTATSTTSNTAAATTPPPPASSTASDTVVATTVTDSNGDETTIFTTVPATSQPSATQSSESETSAAPKSKGISQSTVIGLSVSGGVALLGIVGFLAWKLTRKRFSDDDLDNEAIKWPDLNAHGEDGGLHAPLPTNRTGGAGFETSSQVNLARPDSRAGSVAPSAGSTTELYSAHDPYAVPPLPHLNPNMPYRDDPSQVYYDHDPYAQAAVPPVGEAYAMTQINRTRSPGPQAAYGYDPRAMSPAPQQALGVDYRARSPGPAASLYSGRVSPGPQAGRMSPGPQMAYGQAPGY